MTGTNDPCEYNPTAGRAAFDHETHAPAEFIVGAQGQWRLCGKCAALPEFKKFRTRKPIHLPEDLQDPEPCEQRR
jgi:hypothetical protein